MKGERAATATASPAPKAQAKSALLACTPSPTPSTSPAAMFALRTLRTAVRAPIRRTIASSASRLSAHVEPTLIGEGGKTGQVPTDLEQATGLERFELLLKLQGEDAFSTAPLEVLRLGTVASPIEVFSLVSPPSLSDRIGWGADGGDQQAVLGTYWGGLGTLGVAAGAPR